MKDGKNRILLVDDDPNILQLLQLYLDKEGFSVETAMRGDKALEMFRTNPPNLILLDIMLPGMDGWQVCREIRKTSNIPVIMVTAKDETFDKVLGLELGADDYIAKPFEPKELVARIKAVIRRYQAADTP
nr:response regulator [Clostridia bacterium]